MTKIHSIFNEFVFKNIMKGKIKRVLSMCWRFDFLRLLHHLPPVLYFRYSDAGHSHPSLRGSFAGTSAPNPARAGRSFNLCFLLPIQPERLRSRGTGGTFPGSGAAAVTSRPAHPPVLKPIHPLLPRPARDGAPRTHRGFRGSFAFPLIH